MVHMTTHLWFTSSCLLITIVTLQFKSSAADLAELEKNKMKNSSKFEVSDRPNVAKHNIGCFPGLDNKDIDHSVIEYRGGNYGEIVIPSQIPENMTNVHVMQFKLPRDNLGRKFEVTSAELLVIIKYKRKIPRQFGNQIFKTLTLKLSTVDSRGSPGKVVSSVSTMIRRKIWLKIGLPATVIDNAMQREDRNLYLYLHCDGCGEYANLISINRRQKRVKRKRDRSKGRKSISTLHDLKTIQFKKKHTIRPPLILRTKWDSDAEVCTHNSTCCMVNGVVDFRWDFVIAPKQFVTGYCRGVCSDSTHCCEPVKYKHLSMIYLGHDGRFTFNRLSRVIATKCACRH